MRAARFPRRCSRRRGVYDLTALPVQGCKWFGSVAHGSIRNRWSCASRSEYHPFGVFASRCHRTDERGQEPVWPAILPERYATQSLARSNDAAVSSSGCKRAPTISQGCVFCARRGTSQRLPRVLSAAEAFRSAAVQDAHLCRALLASAAPYSSKRQSPVRPNFPCSMSDAKAPSVFDVGWFIVLMRLIEIDMLRPQTAQRVIDRA